MSLDAPSVMLSRLVPRAFARHLQVLYSFSDQTISEGIFEIKISPGIMLIVCNKVDETSIPLHLLSIETGETLRTLKQPIKRGKKVDIIEQFNEKLMLKQEGSPLLIVDLLTNSVVKVKDTFFKTPSACVTHTHTHTSLRHNHARTHARAHPSYTASSPQNFLDGVTDGRVTLGSIPAQLHLPLREPVLPRLQGQRGDRVELSRRADRRV